MLNNSEINILKFTNMEKTTISNNLWHQDRTIAYVVLYLEILHWFLKFDGI